MYLVIFLLFILNMLCALPLKAQSSLHDTGQGIEKNILIVIGYLDKSDMSQQIFKHEYMYSFSKSIEQSFIENFNLYQFKKTENGHNQVFQKNGTRITILNSNYLCPGEDSELTNRVIICANQHNLSMNIKNYLEQYIMKFNQFIYIGHSRKGMGLGLGPFQPEYNFDIKIYSKSENDKLSKVYLSSCNSIKYYKNKINKNSGIRFFGTDRSKNWRELTDDVIEYLNKEIITDA